MRRGMLRMVLRDMALQLRQFPRRNRRRTEHSGERRLGDGWFFWFYLCTFFPVMIHAYDSVADTVVYWCSVLPVLAAGILCSACSMRLPRMMYLCPMGKPERRRYMTFVFEVKAAAVFCLCLLFQAIPLALGYCNVWRCMEILLAVMFLSLGLNLPWSGMAYRPVWDNGDMPKAEGLKGYRGLLLFQQLVAAFFYILLLMPFVQEDYGTYLWLWGSGIASLVLFFQTALLLICYWNTVIGLLMDYERSYPGSGTMMMR